jgi:hypothetical protein
MSTATLALALPITLDVQVNASVLVTAETRVVAMSRFSERARRLALDFGPGRHILATASDLDALDEATASDLADTLA